jgi:protein-tyrosine-phosphatase
MKTKRLLHLVFVCISNRVRSTFSEFMFPKMLRERDEQLLHEIKVSSAGFIPQTIKDRLAKAHVSLPEPFYNRPMAETTRKTLLKKGIAVPAEWRSKELSPEMVEKADLLVTALPEQKEELIRLYSKAQERIFTIREISQWEEYLIFEDFTGLPMDHTFWDYVEGNPDYVSKVISLTEETLIRAFPNILKKLGVGEYREIEKLAHSSLKTTMLD